MNTDNSNPEPERGFYRVAENWKSDDDGEDYFPGFMNKTGWPMIKIATIIIIFYVATSLVGFGNWSSIVICMLITAFYQDVIAVLTGRIRVPAMDNSTYLGKPVNNIMSSSEQDHTCV